MSSRVVTVLASAQLALLLAISCGTDADSRDAPRRANYTETIRGTEIRFDMVWIADGGFWIGRTEVTWDEFLLYCAFDGTGGIPPGIDAVTRPSEPLPDVAPYDRDWGTGRRPAVGMSWNAAMKYGEWLSLNTGRTYRLPSEAEWQLAADRAPAGALDDYAWFADNSDDMTQEVGQKKPNRHGLHDMLGNLWEYCRNPWAPDEPERAVLRGGCWESAPGEVTTESRLGFEEDWVLNDPNVPPGVWWVPEGSQLGLRILRPGDDEHP